MTSLRSEERYPLGSRGALETFRADNSNRRSVPRHVLAMLKHPALRTWCVHTSSLSDAESSLIQRVSPSHDEYAFHRIYVLKKPPAVSHVSHPRRSHADPPSSLAVTFVRRHIQYFTPTLEHACTCGAAPQTAVHRSGGGAAVQSGRCQCELVITRSHRRNSRNFTHGRHAPTTYNEQGFQGCCSRRRCLWPHMRPSFNKGWCPGGVIRSRGTSSGRQLDSHSL